MPDPYWQSFGAKLQQRRESRVKSQVKTKIKNGSDLTKPICPTCGLLIARGRVANMSRTPRQWYCSSECYQKRPDAGA